MTTGGIILCSYIAIAILVWFIVVFVDFNHIKNSEDQSNELGAMMLIGFAWPLVLLFGFIYFSAYLPYYIIGWFR